ncbi:MAG: peroxiredoxin-like family protein [Mariprofundaceae bacterium]
MNQSKIPKKSKGDKVEALSLPAIDNSTFNLESMQGQRYMLSFFRFAACPFCNLRVHELTKRYDEFGDHFNIIAIFDSPLENLQQHSKDHHAPFPILADQDNQYYRKYAIEHSAIGVLKGMFLRKPTLIKAMLKGYLPTTIKGSITTMPADFLVDENGTIELAHYGSDEGDHLSFDIIKEFSLKQSEKNIKASGSSR